LGWYYRNPGSTGVCSIPSASSARLSRPSSFRMDGAIWVVSTGAPMSRPRRCGRLQQRKAVSYLDSVQLFGIRRDRDG
jgi:hypothetical protein